MLFLSYSSIAAAQSVVSSDTAIKAADEFEKIPRVAVPERPFLFLNREEIAVARSRAEKEEWAKTLKENWIKVAEDWVSRDYDFVKRIIPVKGSIYTYGLGLDLDPVQKKKMKWRGWKDPRHVEAANGFIYPNATHQDDGGGWTDTKVKVKFYFVALANGMTIKQLETVDLPALVNAYLLTGNEKYAERALWILDAIATIYPRANEGPIDYPGLAPGRRDGGRLDRPYYQVARALMNYTYFAEMLFMSSHAVEPSLSNAGSGYTMLKNIELNLLMNGADYCLRMTKAGKKAKQELDNGNIDYNRAPLMVGALLGITEWVDWALNGPYGFRYAVTNTIDINGRYYETGAMYAKWTRDLLLSTANFLRRMRLPDYPNGYEAFDDMRFAQFTLNFFTGIQVAGRLPLFGDSSPDATIHNDESIFDEGTLIAAQQFYRYSEKKAVRDAALQTAAEMLKNMPPDFRYDKFDLFSMYGWDELIKQVQEIKDLPHVSRSTLLFDYGTLILRSGEKNKERAALIRIGPTLKHGQADELGLAFYGKGREFSFDPGYYNTHLLYGYTATTVAHNLLVVNRRNQMRQPSPGGDLQTWTDGEVLRSATVNNPLAYADQNVKEYKRRVALIDLSSEESYIIDNFWACGGKEYDYSQHGIMNGKLQVLSTSKALLKKKTDGSVLSPDVDYSAELDPNGRVTSFPNTPFHWAPPGAGFGFLSRPGFYSMNGPTHLQWSSTDNTGHQMYTWHFAPPSAELITAQSPKLSGTMDAMYALSHVCVPASETVRFTSVILQTAGENKLKEVQHLPPINGSQSAFALRLIPAQTVSAEVREHLYIASDTMAKVVNFDNGLTFSGEEGYLGLDDSGKVASASLTGPGYIIKDDFKITVTPLFTKPLKVLRIESQPLRILVNAPNVQTKRLAGSIIRLNKPTLNRPFVLRVNKSEAAGQRSWLTLDASSNLHAVGLVQSYDPQTNCIITDAPFPHTRPYTYNYSKETGFGLPAEKNIQYDYNGGYNGFWLVDTQNPKKRATIKTLENKRTQIMLGDDSNTIFKSGDKFEIQLIAPGDSFEVPVWGQAKRNAKGTWNIVGPANVSIK